MTMNGPKRFCFAPLQGYTEAFYRNAHRDVIGGIAEYYAPFLRLEQGRPRQKDIRELENSGNDRECTVPQLLVGNGDDARRLIDRVASCGYRRIDFNFGCPFPPVVKSGLGAGMLERPKAMAEVLGVIGEYPQVGFSVKMRLCSDDSAAVLSDAPLVCVVIHPRTAEQGYSGEPDIAAFRRLAERIRHETVLNAPPEYALDASSALMCGRAFLADPLLPLKLQGKDIPDGLLLAFHRALVQNCSMMEQPLQKLKTVWDYLLPDAPKKIRKQIAKCRSLEEYCELAEHIVNR